MENFIYKLEGFLKRQISRSTFLKACLSGLLFFIAQSRFARFAFAKGAESGPRKRRKVKANYDLAEATGEDPYQNTLKVVELLGGMSKFVKKGDTVVIKPNIGWDRTPEQAANTDPKVVAALVELCHKAGAKRVNVFDITCNDARSCYERSGIQAAAEAKGAKVYFADDWNVVSAKFTYSSDMQDWPVFRDAVTCDCFINVPVLKHHGLTGLTLSMKNLMGVCSGARGKMHRNIGPMLVDITDFISPDLNVVDASRVLTKHGPSGGNIADVVTMNRVFASTDATLTDAYACSLMKVDPMNIPYIKEAKSRNFGNADITKANIRSVKA